MNENIVKDIAAGLKVKPEQVTNTLDLLADDATVPFIARYRKEKTGNLNEDQILYIQKQYDYEIKLQERKENVLKLIEQQGKLTDDIKDSVMACTKLSEVEDLYRPYAQKKKTRAATAIKLGLQPLADWLLTLPVDGNVLDEAGKYVTEEVKDANAALQGAKDIVAEAVSDNAKQRWAFKDVITKSGVLHTEKKKDAVDENKVYEMYYDHSEKISSIADHRVMAIDRAEKEKVISVSFEFDEEHLEEEALKNLTHGQATVALDALKEAAEDGCERLLFPSIEREIRGELTERAQAKSIEIFSMNLEKLLLQKPLKGRTVLGFDPGYAHGCKLAVIDSTGKMLTYKTIMPFRGKELDPARVAYCKKQVLDLINTYHVQIIAIGNGTASRESERFCAELIQENQLDVQYAIVSEAGASVWSAQKEAGEEFPDMPIEDRSAVSIARRLLDPLAELIKIDPKSIGVGQYQHDLPQRALNERLDEVVSKCVNRTGCDLNTASAALLTHIAGLNKTTANEIVKYRNENGRFTNREELKKVHKLGDKTFTQCAGFLRIVGGDEPLDETSVHPESYEAAREVMKACDIQQLGVADAVFPEEKIKPLNIDPYTLQDIEDAIRQPLRDYRDSFDTAFLRSDILDIKDLKVGDKLTGTVRNVVDFGAFVDIGLHEDGLVHITHMSMKRISHPSEVVSVGDIVTVYVFGVEEAKNRVQLSLLPLDQLEKRDAAVAYRKSAKDKKKYSKPKKKEVSMDDAMARLMSRFGK